MKQLYLYATRFSIFTAFLFLILPVSAQVYVVNSLADDGSPGTLRDAINKINNGTNTTINFNFSALGTAPYTITLTSSLPTIQPSGSAKMVINGYSEPSSLGGPISSRIISVQLDGNNIAATALTVGYSGIEISGLAIYRCQQTGISVLPGFSNAFIWGNFIGTDYTGFTSSIGNGIAGITVGVFSSATSNTNLIIGTDGNGVNDAWEGNLIVSNGVGNPIDGGIVVSNTTNSRFSGNIIGLGRDGISTSNLFNNGSGLALFDRSVSNTIGTNGDGISDGLERNFISNNARGVLINSKSNGNWIANNVIGLDNTGGDAGNIAGIIIDNSSDCLIGTNADGISDLLERNNISGSNGEPGITIKSGNLGATFDQNSDGNKIVGNSIGVAFDGISSVGNEAPGILLMARGSYTINNTIIGSEGNGINESVKGNTIANNSFYDAIKMEDVSNSNLIRGTRISRNSIYNNGGAGINFVNPGNVAGTGITPNQPTGFSISGPNNLLNFPVITSITSDFQNITISGFARPGAILEFYIADKSAMIPTPLAGLTKNFGQGRTFLFQARQGATLNGITDVGTNTAGTYTTTDQGTASGASPITVDYSFQFVVNAASIGITTGATLSFTALAIDASNTSGNANNTSGFSSNFDANLVSLPITLLDFTGSEKEGKVYLQWSTSQEYNNASFDIEKSSNGINFGKIGNVKANSGTSIRKYNFIDNQISGNVNLYRLKQIDVDGKHSYSKVITLRLSTTGSIKLFPSPFKSNLNISLHSKINDNLNISIVDPSGRVVKRYSMPVSIGNNSFNIDKLSELPPGIYFINISGQAISHQQKISKN